MSTPIPPPIVTDTPRPNAVLSPTHIIHVLGYTPTEGERGVPITVHIHLQQELVDATYIRLVIGQKAVATKVRELPGGAYGRWQLDAIAPPFQQDRYSSSSSKVLLSVQALNQDNTILDSVTFGEFSYWSSTCPFPLPSSAISPNGGCHPGRTPDSATLPSKKLPGPNDPPPPTMRRRGATMSSVPSSTSTFANSPQSKMRIHRRLKTQTIVRAKNAPATSGEKLVAHTPILELVTPLANICRGWAQAELNAGRRLVRFSKVQDGRKLIVSCEPIRQEEYCETDAVISCIYREETDNCFVTSVDVIYLLERLTNGEFPVEEKNRIRRNLEGLRPTTVSKHKAGFGDFFQRIMEFPDPKPRNIEKDLKVFDWNLLDMALEKILSKYSIYTSANETGSTSPASEPSPIDSPELVAMQPTYLQPEEETVSPNFVKFEPATNDYQTLMVNSTEAFDLSPVDSVTTASSSSSPAAFPLLDAFDSVRDIWAAGMKVPLDMPPLEGLGLMAGYEGLETMDGTTGYTHNSLDFSLYDSLHFPIPPDDSLNLAEQHYVGSL
ncbi:developmental regulator medusa [Coprinopsis sp. MPI-PUGE-AT-0042]|nr:developmental regulator medusa [Coprinopsis sp. MPI-PUGE-AT-0042]